MTCVEFKELCEEIKPSYRPFTSEEYYIIEIVYMYYPSIKVKKDIASLYVQFGMTIINDMLDRSVKIKDLENEIQQQQTTIEKLKKAKLDLEN